MSSGYDDEYDDRPADDQVVARARAKVAAPGLALILAGLFGIVLEFISLTLIAAYPTFPYDLAVYLTELGPPGADRQKQLDDLKKKEAEMRADTPLNVGFGVLGVVLGLLTIGGGVKARSLSGYGFAMTGAVAAIIPLGGCCCVSLPVGVWALVVLMSADVKAGFAAAARPPRDEY